MRVLTGVVIGSHPSQFSFSDGPTRGVPRCRLKFGLFAKRKFIAKRPRYQRKHRMTPTGGVDGVLGLDETPRVKHARSPYTQKAMKGPSTEYHQSHDYSSMSWCWTLIK